MFLQEIKLKKFILIFSILFAMSLISIWYEKIKKDYSFSYYDYVRIIEPIHFLFYLLLIFLLIKVFLSVLKDSFSKNILILFYITTICLILFNLLIFIHPIFFNVFAYNYEVYQSNTCIWVILTLIYRGKKEHIS